ncbi:MAG: DUF1778 domain-containing protein [Dehalococcoidia bacterium]
MLESERSVEGISQQALDDAARMLGQSTSEFVRSAAEERAEQVLADESLRPHLWPVLGSVRLRADLKAESAWIQDLDERSRHIYQKHFVGDRSWLAKLVVEHADREARD